MASPLVNGASVVMSVIGVLFSLLTLLGGVVTAQAFIERLQNGRGIMFADAEFLTIATVACAVVAALSFLAGAKLRGK